MGPTEVSFLSLNARSILPKIEELTLLVAKAQPSLVFITETWLDDSVPSTMLSLPEHSSCIRRDRLGRRGGGVLLLVRDGLSFSHRNDLQLWGTSGLSWFRLMPAVAVCFLAVSTVRQTVISPGFVVRWKRLSLRWIFIVLMCFC